MQTCRSQEGGREIFWKMPQKTKNDSTPERLQSKHGGRQKHSGVSIAAAQNNGVCLAATKTALESVWLPPNRLCPHENDSSPGEDNCKQKKKSPTVIVCGVGK
ncbi:hypothetical protein PoB_001405400 [Plakobranchus ocellatus]|uniref:Uncharacterized protein n=1 Tax=Plakobranchus ocellatus TaxID=259542 RepID=A0AAV3Z0J4_9GAST|nr:hypothetical protein PoB_001405400 [Plakobranchus ocellatus]